MKKYTNNNRLSLLKPTGFTLIEVVLVLAIAGLIMTIVFLAVGGAQRTRRDAARKNNAGRVLAALESYSSNNGVGALGVNIDLPSSYLNNIVEPSGNGSIPTSAADHGRAGNVITIKYSARMICDPANPGQITILGAAASNNAVSYWTEAGGNTSAACVDDD